jgi:hypothetical protein
MIKPFRSYLKEKSKENTYYTLDLLQGTSSDGVLQSVYKIIPVTLKLLQNYDVTITVEPRDKTDES